MTKFKRKDNITRDIKKKKREYEFYKKTTSNFIKIIF